MHILQAGGHNTRSRNKENLDIVEKNRQTQQLTRKMLFITVNGGS